MAYTSDALKKEYKKETDNQRKKNLKKIREDIARLSLSDFAKETGITKCDLSMLENGDKLLSLFHIQAYKKFFLENHKINLSVDFIMGFTYIMENNNLNYQKQIGLSSDAIETLQKLRKSHGKLLDVANFLLSDKDKAIALLSNIRIIIADDIWQPCVALCTDDDTEQILCEPITTPRNLGFCSTDTNGNNCGVLVIDESILKSHSILKIQEILENYKGSYD